jgi:phosphomannomutase
MQEVDRVVAVPRTGPDDPDIVRLDHSIVDHYVQAAVGLLDASGPRSVRVGYTAMHGVGAEVLRAAFAPAGFPALTEVLEQVEPDPDFPTVAFPNPEEPGALDLGLAVASGNGLDVLLANDPDADRLGVAVPDPAAGRPDAPSGWRALRGDEIGVLITHHLLASGRVHDGSVLATTIVSSTLMGRMAAAAGVPYVETLTGFKWISRAPGPGQVLAFGYEEALGYCVDGVVADKDGITAALVFAELVATLAAQGRSVLDVLDDLALTHGLHQTGQWTARVAGPDAMVTLTGAMTALRAALPTEVAGRSVVRVDDLAQGDPGRGFGPNDVITLHLEGARVVVRPSGTEPKLKCYVEVVEPVADRADLPDARVRALAAIDDVIADLARLIRL